MGIFGRIRKIFSRSDSSSTDRRHHGHGHEITTEYNQVECNRYSNVSTSSQRSSSVVSRPSHTALHRSNTTSVATRASSTSHAQPDASLQRANSYKGFTLPLLGNAVYSAEYVKASNTSTNVSQLPRSTESQEYVNNQSKISNENDSVQKYARRSDSKPTPAEYSTTGVGYSKSHRKASELNILQSTLKPEYRKQTANQNTLPPTQDAENVNSPDTFAPTTKLKRPSSSISTVSENRKHRSTVEVERSSTSRYPMLTTSREAKTAKESNTTIKPSLATTSFPSSSLLRRSEVGLSRRMPPPSVPTHNPTDTTVSAVSDYKRKSYNIPAILQQGATLTKNNTPQTSSIVKASVFVPKQDRSKAISEISSISQQDKTLDKNNTTQTSSIAKSYTFVPFVPSCKIESPKLSDHNREKSEVFGNSQQSTKLSKTNTTQTSSYSSNTKTSAFVPSIRSHKVESPDYNRRISQVWSISQQGTTLNKNHTTQASSISKVSCKLDTSTIPDHMSEIGEKYGFSKEFQTVNAFRNLSPVPMDVDEPTIPQLTHTHFGVDEVAEPSAGLISFASRFGLYSVKDTSPGRNQSTESNLQRLNPSSEIPKPYNPKVTPTTAFVPWIRSTSEESEDDIVIEPQYSLRNFTTKLQTPPKDKSFKTESDVIYHNQWTECSAQILDEFDDIVRSRNTVEVSSNSRHVDFHDFKIKKGRLYFRMKSSQTGNISVFLKIENFTLTKIFDVAFNPCSSCLSDLAIEKVNPVEDEFVFRVFIFDVFGEPVPSNSTANLELDASFQCTENKVVNKVKHIEQGQMCYDITVKGDRPWSRDLVVLLNGEPVRHAQEFEFADEECEAINGLEDEDYEWIQQIFDEDDRGIFIPLTTGEDDGKFISYHENGCELQSQNAKNHKLVCKNVKKYDILGPDFAHINNIKRVLELKDRVEVQETAGDASIDLRNIKSHLHPICKEVVQHLLRGLYYRRKASEAARVRMEWKNRQISIDEVLWLDAETPSFVFCKYFKDFFGDLLNRYNREACEELLKFFNFHRDENEVDLHGLLVADEEKLELLRLNLLIGSLSRCRDYVDAIIRRCRLESDEAIRKLKETLDNFDLEEAIKNNTPWLEIIVGAGHHSRKNEQNIRPKVEKLLKERNLKFAAVNKGSLAVTFKPYSGPEPCFGEYYCANCDRCWKSSKSYVKKYQRCVRCKAECWPVKQREKDKVVNYHRDGAGSVKRQSKPHQSSLCQKCEELGYPCNEDDYCDSD